MSERKLLVCMWTIPATQDQLEQIVRRLTVDQDAIPTRIETDYILSALVEIGVENTRLREQKHGDEMLLTTILNAHRLLRSRYKRKPLWSFISDVTALGSTSSQALCRQYGWSPDQDGFVQLKRP